MSLTTVRDHVGPSLKYVEFVLYPTSIFTTFVAAADKVLEPILPGGRVEGSSRQGGGDIICDVCWPLGGLEGADGEQVVKQHCGIPLECVLPLLATALHLESSCRAAGCTHAPLAALLSMASRLS